MMTPESDGGGVFAPFLDKFTTDSVMKNQNVSDFYDTVDELTKNANSMHATDDDILKSKYMSSVNSELGELYKQKREIQNSDLSDEEKDEAVRDIQKQIDELAKTGLSSYENIHYEGDGDYAVIGGKYFQYYTPEKGDPYWRKLDDEQTVKYNLTKNAGDAHYVTDGNVHYRLGEDGKWTKISDRDLARQNEVTKALGITPDEYWRNTDVSFIPMKNGEYEYAYENPGKYAISKAVGGFDVYSTYSDEISKIAANNDSSSGTKDKDLIKDYIFGLDIDEGQKAILYRSKYDSAEDKRRYNPVIVEYLDSRDDISYEEMVEILEELGMTIKNGYVYWD